MQLFAGGMSMGGMENMVIVSFHPRTRAIYQPLIIPWRMTEAVFLHLRNQGLYCQSRMPLKGAGEFPSSVYFIKLMSLQKKANALFNSIPQTEVTPPSRRPISPNRATPVASGSGLAPSSGTTLVPPSTPTRRRLFTYNLPSTSNPATPTRRLGTPANEAYLMVLSEQLVINS